MLSPKNVIQVLILLFCGLSMQASHQQLVDSYINILLPMLFTLLIVWLSVIKCPNVDKSASKYTYPIPVQCPTSLYLYFGISLASWLVSRHEASSISRSRDTVLTSWIAIHPLCNIINNFVILKKKISRSLKIIHGLMGECMLRAMAAFCSEGFLL